MRMPDATLFQISGGRARLEAVLAVFDPARLTQARQSFAWTKKHLADELRVSPAAVGQYESGIIRPRAEQLQRIADLLKVPPEFFAIGRPRADLDTSQTHFRSLRSMRTYERDQALTFVEQTWELCHALERRVRLPTLDLPHLGDDTNSAVAARAVRQQWGLETGPIPHLVRTMESHGILVGLLPFSDSGRVDAFSTCHHGRPIVVLASDKPSVYRHRFTAAHELAHLVLHKDAQPGDIRHEREADAFAAEFLMPTQSVADALPRRIDFTKLIRLQKLWGVGVEALLYRSCELGVITYDSHRRARIKLAGLRSQGVVRDEEVNDFAGELPALLLRAFQASRDSLSDLAHELAWTEEFLLGRLGSPDGRPRLELVNLDD
jgi:Zn-dependent peptidase ImmA (M78 family)/transcriptional regulator with XRE-family HTH domain